MTKPRMPIALSAWLLATRILSGPLILAARRVHRRMDASPDRFAERLGQPSRRADGPVVWFHAASLGEVAQIGPLVQALAKAGRELLVTTTTQSGAEWIARELPEVHHQFAPLDTPGAVAGFLDGWDISAALFIEGDFGPRLTGELRRRGIPQALVNARHSSTRARFPAVFAALMDGFAFVTCRSNAVAESLRALGLPRDRIRVLPDLRTATAQLPCPADILTSLQAQIGDRPVWLAASTHPPDEAAVLTAHRAVLAQTPEALLILAPRHPTRGAPLETAASALGLTITRRSIGDPPEAGAQVYIADTLGELGVFFALAQITFLGGSFGDEGGHNPYEPASFGSAILSGPKVKNFAAAYAALTDAGAADLVSDQADFGPRIVSLLGSKDASEMGAAGRRFMKDSGTSVAETLALIEGLLGPKGR